MFAFFLGGLPQQEQYQTQKVALKKCIEKTSIEFKQKIQDVLILLY